MHSISNGVIHGNPGEKRGPLLYQPFGIDKWCVYLCICVRVCVCICVYLRARDCALMCYVCESVCVASDRLTSLAILGRPL